MYRQLLELIGIFEVLTNEEILKYFRDKAEGKLKVKERKVFLSEKLKNIKLNEN